MYTVQVYLQTLGIGKPRKSLAETERASEGCWKNGKMLARAQRGQTDVLLLVRVQKSETSFFYKLSKKIAACIQPGKMNPFPIM